MTTSTFFPFRFVGDYTLSGKQHACDRCSVFKGNTGNFGRINDSSSKQFLILVCTGIVTKISFSFPYFLDNNRSFNTSIINDCAKRCLKCTANNG